MKIGFNRYTWALLTLLVLGALCFWVAASWNVWFYNPPEPPYAGTGPSRILLTFNDDNELHRSVTWVGSSELEAATLELVEEQTKDTVRLDAEAEVFHSRAGQRAFYRVSLKELEWGKKYLYRVSCGDSISPFYAFQTPEDKRQKYAFMYVGDIQDTLQGTVNQTLKEAFKRSPEMEFMLCTGDLAERPMDQYWDEAFHSMDSIAQAVPVLNVAGNHDYLKNIIYELEHRFALTFPYFLDSKKEDNHVYTLTYQDMQFFILDSTREFFYLPAQRAWLQEKLHESLAKWKIVVLHHPLYSVKGKYQNLMQRMAFDDIIRQYDVDVVLQGHEHAYARTTNTLKDGTQTTPIYLISHCSPKNYHIEFDERFQKFGSGSQYYQKISVDGNELTIEAFDAQTHELYDKLTLVKNLQGSKILDQGKNIKERVELGFEPVSKKEKKFAKRIEAYHQNHPERFN